MKIVDKDKLSDFIDDVNAAMDGVPYIFSACQSTIDYLNAKDPDFLNGIDVIVLPEYPKAQNNIYAIPVSDNAVKFTQEYECDWNLKELEVE